MNKKMTMKSRLTNTIGMGFRLIEAGSFATTSPHFRVIELTLPFYIGINCVTQLQFAQVMGYPPNRVPDRQFDIKDSGNYPVTEVTWKQAIDFCKTLSGMPEEKRNGRSYRLPTEAEWEYCCRAGSKGLYTIDLTDDYLGDYANYLNCSGEKIVDGTYLSDLRFAENSPFKTNRQLGEHRLLKVGTKRPNAWGLFDMHGNVWEWCSDVFGTLFPEFDKDPTGPLRGSHHVIRGGSFVSTAEDCSSVSRRYKNANDCDPYTGFRVILEVSRSTKRHFVLRSKFVNFEAKESSTKTKEQIVNSVGMTFAEVPPGKFTMGSLRQTEHALFDGRLSTSSAMPMMMHEAERVARYMICSSQPAPGIGLDISYKYSQQIHEVTLTKPFYISCFQVTQEQYSVVMGSNPSFFNNAKNPVESVTWFDAVEFCKKLSVFEEERNSRRIYRLPTEAEWEYACRCDSDAEYCFGSDIELLNKFAWFNENSGKKPLALNYIFSGLNYAQCLSDNGCSTHEVGAKLSNPLGLYDMHGNVCEWCMDWADDYEDVVPINVKRDVEQQNRVALVDSSDRATEQVVYRRPKTWSSHGCYGMEVVDPKGPNTGTAKVIRGGSWYGDYERCQSSYRGDMPPDRSNKTIGFRVVMEYLPIEAPISVNTQISISPRFGQYASDEIENSIGMGFRGVPTSDSLIMLPTDHERPFKIRLEESYFLGSFPVTQDQFNKVMGFNPSVFKGSSLPVQNVTWFDACRFCALLSAIPTERAKGFRYRLPSEIEWEIASRCCSDFKFFFGADDRQLDNFAWFDRNSGVVEIDPLKLWNDEPVSDKVFAKLIDIGCRPHPVGEKASNAWGFYDMYGNVREWCSNKYGTYSNIRNLSENIYGPDITDGAGYVCKGGSFLDSSENCDSGYRYQVNPYEQNCFTGFRVVLVTPDLHYST
jgi:formylglycine-generating enzyme required for sulfatase activity